MRFELTERYKRSQHFQCCALNQLDHLSKLETTDNILPQISWLVNSFSRIFFTKFVILYINIMPGDV